MVGIIYIFQLCNNTLLSQTPSTHWPTVVRGSLMFGSVFCPRTLIRGVRDGTTNLQLDLLSHSRQTSTLSVVCVTFRPSSEHVRDECTRYNDWSKSKKKFQCGDECVQIKLTLDRTTSNVMFWGGALGTADKHKTERNLFKWRLNQFINLSPIKRKSNLSFYFFQKLT